MGTGDGEGGLWGIKVVAEDPRPCCWPGEAGLEMVAGDLEEAEMD